MTLHNSPANGLGVGIAPSHTDMQKAPRTFVANDGRVTLKNVYRGAAAEPPAALDQHIVPHSIVWSFAQQVAAIPLGDRLTVCTNCPGRLTWCVDGGEEQSAPLVAAGGVMAAAQRHHVTLGPFPPAVRIVRFRFHCAHEGCDCRDVCCRRDEQAVQVRRPRAAGKVRTKRDPR